MRLEILDWIFETKDLRFEILDDLRFETRDLRFEILDDLKFEILDDLSLDI